MTKWPSVPLDEVMSLEREAHSVEAESTYRIAGVYSFGRGMFWRQPTAGAGTNYKTLFKVKTGQAIMSKLFGWEGAFAVVPSEFDGAYVSPEFPTFTLAPDRLDRGYLQAILRWPDFYRSLTTTGMGDRRQRVSPQAFLTTEIPLPPLDEQRRIAARIRDVERLRSQITERSRSSVEPAVTGAVERAVGRLEDEGWKVRRIGDVAEVNPKRQRVVDSADAHFVPMAAVDDRSGSIARPEVCNVSEVSRGYKQFLRGDVIFARITPCMQNGKAAVFEPPDDVVAGYGSTEFHVMRPHAVSPAWLHTWVRRSVFRREAMTAFTGTAGQQRVPADFLRDARILVAPDAGAEARAIAALGRVDRIGLEIRSRVESRAALLKAVGVSVLNDVFGG